MAFSGTRPGLGEKKATKPKSQGIGKIVHQGKNPLVAALASNLPVETTKTENGMKTYKSSLNAATDFFFMAAALRKGGRVNDVTNMFAKVYQEDKLLAIKLLFWLRDIRGGAGEKIAFKMILNDLFRNNKDIFNQIIRFIPEYGSFKDLLVFDNKKREAYVKNSEEVRNLFASELKAGNGLAAKWLPRPSGKHVEEGSIMAKHMGMTLKEYRHLLAELSNTVEQQMSARRWEDITYEHVPSQAMHIYRTAFFKHDAARFEALITKANKGEVVLKAGAIFPGDLVDKLRLSGDYRFLPTTTKQEVDAINAQWLGLPNYMEGIETSMIVAADVSGSMRSANVIQHSIALALYVGQHMQGPFRNTMMTYSNTSKFFMFKEGESLSTRIAQITEDNMGTDLSSVFSKLLQIATANSIAAEHMPKVVVVVTDMEFNSYDDKSAVEMASKMYKKAGYPTPHLVFWNMASRQQNVPARANEQGISLISGYSPAIMKSVLQAKPMSTPTELMLETINGPRYEQITI